MEYERATADLYQELMKYGNYTCYYHMPRLYRWVTFLFVKLMKYRKSMYYFHMPLMYRWITCYGSDAVRHGEDTFYRCTPQRWAACLHDEQMKCRSSASLPCHVPIKQRLVELSCGLP